MNKIIFILIFVFVFISFASAVQNPQIYYKLNLDYNYGNITINSSEIKLSDKTLSNNFGFYSASVLDYKGNILNLTLFDVPNKILYDSADSNGTINGGGQLELNQTNFDIFVPYYENAKEIRIYNQNLIEVSRKDISEFSKEKPKINETQKPAIPAETGKKETPNGNLADNLLQYWWVLLIILAVLVIVLFYSLRKEK